MESFRTPSLELTERLDPGHYRPVLLENEARLRQFGVRSLSEFYERSGIGHTAAVTPHYAVDGDGVPFVSGGCIVDGRLDFSAAERIKQSSHVGEMSGSRLEPGFVLFVRKGDIGNSAIVPPSTEANCSSEIVFLEPTAGVDGGFLSSYFNSRQGRMAFLRQQRGMMITSISLYDVPEIPVPAVRSETQRYIGEKVRQAERLREKARRLELEAAEFFSFPEWTEPRAGSHRSYHPNRLTLRPERLDAPFYDPGHDSLEGCLRKRGAVEIGQLATLVDDKWDGAGVEFLYFEIGELDVSSGVLSPSSVATTDAPSRAQISVAAWDVLVSTVRPNRKNVGVVLPTDSSLPLVASNGFSALRFSNPASAVFCHAFLRSDAATQQLMRWNSGATYPAIEGDVPLRILVPEFAESVVNLQGQRWLTKFAALDSATRLVDAAKLLVEDLIEGKISEGDLISAQQALERGDRAADKAILQRLTRKGVDVPSAPPLFPDVNALYTILDSLDHYEAAP